jgi:ribose transport system substrate-binding protein
MMRLVLLVSIILAGCTFRSTPPTPSPTEPGKVVLGISVSNLNTPFFATLTAGAMEAANRLGAELTVKDARDDAGAQGVQIEELIELKVSALLINPVGGEAVSESIASANKAGIPVFTLDRSATEEHGGAPLQIVSHIASDNRTGGKMAGNYLAEMLGKKGKIVEIQGIPDTSAAQDRGAGFNGAIAAYPEIEVVVREPANFDREAAKEVFAEILKQQPEVDGVFAHNDEMILGAIDAARESGQLDKDIEDQPILFVGFDAVESAIDALETGELTATIAQQPAEMGRLGVETALKFLNGETVPDNIPVDLALITR